MTSPQSGGSAPDKFVPKATPETQPYWDAAAAGRLDIQRCTACERPFFYPRTSCPHCGSEKVAWFTASGRATLYSYVISERPAPGFPTPTVIATVELEEGPRMMTNIVDVDPTPEALPLDLPLQVRFEQRGEVAVPVFAPIDGGDR
ncbi:Zn-ribbon domain-containing OB-fold protein [Nocardioides insulae]|uniref:Zn-ribbon domain-containing OB-fold protein n=1 Tax=Nocardioides insulae TaxID=394734 RepID=UPI0003FFAC7B|nr:OB-fold domain-containing protein [Nocardioides insulae]